MLVALLLGLPASGKSSLALELQESLDQSTGTRTTTCIHFDEYEELPEIWDDTTYKTSRQNAIAAFRIVLDQNNQEESPRRFIILDDLFHLHSMRREIYVICRDAGIPLASIYLHIHPDVARERNALRSGRTRVSDEVGLN